MRGCSVDDNRVDAEIHLVQVGLGDAHAHVRNADDIAAGFSELDSVYGDGSAYVRGENLVDIACDVQVHAERAFKILVVDKVFEVGLGDGERELVERHVHAEVLRLHVELHFHAQVAAVRELEVHADVGVLVAEVHGGNGYGEIFQVNLGADLEVFVNDVALFERDVFEGDAKAD